ncbi:bifunctional 3-(3-hydroxy-phenyl)propionate/3-hydroxycinnamic acid hydroxylase [Actinomadura opuntiae]|uniref:bifunctional 3-(3-hydroxy-phenyl)propionate/3-hydroxycinnamic acid hydroxylase n=1 Tax=Actinomadura sp. OS1-43 TaxID=604315 RepID=UPI00255B11E3|nr:bifunctional 3-(3-hydroxy-phenyl)propionate/3-hydroxycinnamic acid hydroxylase [Actinomadura sp. OS1-43]MDL4813271.1 bifunctional 3-(3-hydroxy-phenyl)propionate/3-hydroxycinnamic acid hydroxylase [Actinomadura sp. OS1-43]
MLLETDRPHPVSNSPLCIDFIDGEAYGPAVSNLRGDEEGRMTEPDTANGGSDAQGEAMVDVAVVGYGPVGMAVTALLGQAGRRVVALERYAGLYNLPRAATFDDETMRTLARLGVAERLLPNLRVQRTYEWRNGGGDLLIEQQFTETGRSGWAEWYMMYQPDLEEALDDVCRSLPTVQVRHSSPVVDLEQDGEGVLLTIEGPQGTERIAARYVVACDGGNSFVRRRLGIGQQDYGFSEPWMVCDFRFRRPVDVPPALQLGDPHGPTSIISIGLAHHRFSFMLDSEADFEVEREPDRVWRRVARHLGPDDAELIRVATYTFRSLISDDWRRGRIVLAGDAAHQMPPFLGQGMCSGIRDAQNLAFKLDLILRGVSPDDLLDTYQREREPHVRAVTEKGIELGHMQTIRDPERAAARDRELLARRAAARESETFRFPGLADGLLARDSGPGRGLLSVQGVVDDGSRRDRLDQLVGAGFHLIVDQALLARLDRPEILAALRRAGVQVVAPGEQAAEHPDVAVVRDVHGTYRRWFADLGCSAAAVRPDFYVFGTAGDADATTALARELLAVVGGLATERTDSTTGSSEDRHADHRS